MWMFISFQLIKTSTNEKINMLFETQSLPIETPKLQGVCLTESDKGPRLFITFGRTLAGAEIRTSDLSEFNSK